MNIDSNMASYQVTLAEYMTVTKLTPDEVLDKKGRDLGIKLYQGFAQRKFGGAGKKRAGLAKAELAQRTSQGRGTKVRDSLMSEYLAARGELRESTDSFVGPRTEKAQLRGIKAKVSLWQSFVGREVRTRQGGIGALAASFLWFRKRSSQARGKYFVLNKFQTKNMGFVERGENFLRIVGITDGLSAIDTRYGIAADALAKSEADMRVYVNRKHEELGRRLFGGNAR